MNTYKLIDEKNWQRAAHCAIFKNCIEPSFCVTFEVDVTNFREFHERLAANSRRAAANLIVCIQWFGWKKF